MRAKVAEFAQRLPFATYMGKHKAAVQYFTDEDAAVVLVQECRNLVENEAIQELSRRACTPIYKHMRRNTPPDNAAFVLTAKNATRETRP